MSAAVEMIQAKRVAAGPHILHIERSLRANGSKKLSSSILTLPAVKMEDMLLEPIIERRCAFTGDFDVNVFFPDKEQRESILHQAAILAVQSLTQYSPGFKKYQNEELFQFSRRRPLPDEHRTRNIPVVSTVGEQFSASRFIALMRDTYVTKLHLDEKSIGKRAIPCISDTFTNVTLRRAQINPSTSDDDMYLITSLQFGPGLGDILRKLVAQLIKNHCPKGAESKGGLARLFRTINKGHLALGKPQDYEAALSALDTIVKSSFLDCWRINCGCDSLEAYAASNPTPEDMLALAKKIVIKHLKRIVPKQPERFEDDRKYSDELSDEEKNDDVYRNHRLLLRDATYIILLEHAISDADFGRVEDLLGVIAVSLMGAGLEDTCFEILHFLNDLKFIWPEPFGNIMRDSMIVNYFKKSSNSMPADISLVNLAKYSEFYYESYGWESEWQTPKTMDEAIALVDRFDDKLAMKSITDRMADDNECVVM